MVTLYHIQGNFASNHSFLKLTPLVVVPEKGYADVVTLLPCPATPPDSQVPRVRVRAQERAQRPTERPNCNKKCGKELGEKR